jgi:pimeloyl-ACP methyl ester carboxylesterase
MAESFALRFLIAFFALLSLSACETSSGQRADLKHIYDQTAQYHMPDRNPIIVIPGILGSRLVDDDTGTIVWGAFRANFADPTTEIGARLVSLPLNESGGTIQSSIRPDGVLENLELNLAGFPISIQAYAGILATLGAGGYRDETLGLNSIDYGNNHFTCFQFDYDWRKDIASNAAALQVFIEEKRRDVQRNYKEQYGIDQADVKFDIAAHSMGGLLTRYYLMYGDAQLPTDGSLPALTWAGARDVERAILVAPPNAGSVDAFEQLLSGSNLGRPLLPRFDAGLLGTFPSIYQLLPRERHNRIVWDAEPNSPVEKFRDPALWQHYGWGLSGRDDNTAEFLRKVLPDVDDAEARHQIATSFQAHALTLADRFHAALDRPATPPSTLEMFLVAGDSKSTPETMSIDRDTGKATILAYGVGDGRVLRSSALLDERTGADWKPTVQTPIEWDGVLFLPSDHRSLTTEPIFEDNVLYLLLEDPR